MEAERERDPEKKQGGQQSLALTRTFSYASALTHFKIKDAERGDVPKSHGQGQRWAAGRLAL